MSGYYHNTGNIVNKKDRQIKLEGVLEGVTICVLQERKIIITVNTNEKGFFQLVLKTGNKYQVDLSKAGYSKSSLLVDLKDVPGEIASEGLAVENFEMLLNSYIPDESLNKIKPFGRLFYNVDKKSLDFEETNVKIRKGIFSKEKIENPSVSLIRQAILKNKNNSSVLRLNNKKTPENKPGNTNPAKQPVLSPFLLKNIDIENITDSDIKKRESELVLIRKQIEKDKLNIKTAQDSVIISQSEAMLLLAEKELSTAKKYIAVQKEVISNQRRVLILVMGFSLFILLFLFVIYKNHRQKKAANLILEQKNKKITDSINYAQRIQQSILLSDKEIKKIVPDSFVFYQPRDIVSGDFYWFSEAGQKIIIAAVDCTGHGVPGAFMSFIGYSLMNEIINEKKITRPSEVLNKLHQGIVSLLRQNSGDLSSQDGMELSLCVFDKKSGTLEYAGAMNPVYIIRNNEILILTPDEHAIGGIAINKNISFTDKQISISENDILYLFSDGFTDQFGGEKNTKFNIPRFKNLLLEIHEKHPGEQKSLLEEAINKWKGKYRQIDDLLIIGVRF